MNSRHLLIPLFSILAVALTSLGAQPVSTEPVPADFEQVRLSDGTTVSLPTSRHLSALSKRCSTFTEYDKRLGCASDILAIARLVGSLKYRADIQRDIKDVHVGFGAFVAEYIQLDAAVATKKLADFNAQYQLAVASAVK